MYDPRPGITRALHPLRRFLALRSLSRVGRSRGVMFVCFGNICRSPYAAARFSAVAEWAAGSWEVQVGSAGFGPGGRPCPRAAVLVARERGCALDYHLSRQVDRKSLEAVEWVFVMNALQAREISRRYGKQRSRIVILGDLDPIATGCREVEDPWNKSDDVFRQSYNRIDRCLETLVRAWSMGMAGAERGKSGFAGPARSVRRATELEPTSAAISG